MTHLSVLSLCLLASRIIGGSFKFTRLNGREVIFTDSLNDPNSAAYRNLENFCYKILHDVLMNIVSARNNEWDVEITGFSSGSVVVDFEVMVFDSDRDNLNDEAAAVETSLGLQQPGVWQTADGSVSLNVESIVAFEVICPLPNHPFSHVVIAQSVYRKDEFITIQCDDKEEYVVWQCNGTSGDWIQLANLDCRPGSEGGLSTGAIFGIVFGIVVIIGMICCFLYKLAQMKRQTAIDEILRNRGPCPETPIQSGMENRAFNASTATVNRQTAIDEVLRNGGPCPENPIQSRMENRSENSYAGSMSDLSTIYDQVYE